MCPPSSPPVTNLQADLSADRIQRVPLERWDLDQAEALQGDALTLSAQVTAAQLLTHYQWGSLLSVCAASVLLACQFV